MSCLLSGNLICGECQCFDRPDTADRYFGSGCECSGNHTDPRDPDLTCRPPTGGPLCSGRGVCECGECVCEEGEGDMRIYGSVCQCDNMSCDRDRTGALCGSHGLCDCGTCQCEAGWSGPACDCDQSVSQCLGEEEKLCSGHGECECGLCRCDDGWTGELCDYCPTCVDTCHLLAECVECLQWQLDRPTHPTTCFQECQLTITSYALITTSESLQLEDTDSNWFYCAHRNESNCKYSFLYKELSGKDEVEVLLDRESIVCPPQPDYLGWIIGEFSLSQSNLELDDHCLCLPNLGTPE